MMVPEILFIFLYSLLLVFLIVPTGGYTLYRDRYGRKRVKSESQTTEEEIGMGVTMLFFFLVLFPLLLAGQRWVTPVGPLFMGIAWAPILLMGVLFSLLIAAVAPRRPRKPRALPPEEEENLKAAPVFGITFFLFLILAVVLLGLAAV